MRSNKEVLTERFNTMNAMKKILATCDSAGRNLSASEKGEFDKLDLHFDILNAEVREMHLGNDFSGIDDRNPESDFNNRPMPRQRPSDSRPGGNLIDLAVAGWCRNLHGVPIPREEFRAAEQLGFDPRGNAFAIRLPLCRPTLGSNLSFGGESLGSQIIGSDVRGGYLVDGFLGRFEKALMATAPMLQLAEVIITPTGLPLNWPSLDDTGAEGEQLGEGGAATADEITTFGSHTFSAHKLSSKIVKASHELVRDSAIALASEIGTIFGERLGRALNRRATTGSGSQTLKGVLESATLGRTSASATEPSFDDLIYLQHSVDPAYRTTGKRVGFMMHSDTAGYVRRLKDSNGQYLWQNSTIIGQPPTLLGEPVWINQMLDSSLVASAKPILYGDFSKYKIRIVGGTGTDGNGIRFRQLNELYAANDLIGFVSFLEADGILLTPSSTSSLCPVRYLQLAA